MSKILIDEDTVKLALEALELNNSEWKDLADSGDSGCWKAEDQGHYQLTNEAITSLREALAEQPPQRKPLTLREIGAACGNFSNETIKVVRQTEAAHGIKENT